jgi:hypothetical protein
VLRNRADLSFALVHNLELLTHFLKRAENERCFSSQNRDEKKTEMDKNIRVATCAVVTSPCFITYEQKRTPQHPPPRQNNTELGPGICPKSPKSTRILKYQTQLYLQLYPGTVELTGTKLAHQAQAAVARGIS